MRMVRVFCPGPLALTERYALPKEASHHVSTVLKMRPGEAITVFNGEGGAYVGVLISTGKNTVASLTQFLSEPLATTSHATLVIALLRGEKMDWVIQKATELGVDTIQLLVTERTVASVPSDRLAQRQLHWQQVAISACEQCGRTRLPVIHAPKKLGDYLRTISKQNLLWVAALDTATPLPHQSIQANTHSHFLVGPEGGFSDTEMEMIYQAGFTGFSLGPWVLRAETAAVSVLSCWQYAAALTKQASK